MFFSQYILLKFVLAIKSTDYITELLEKWEVQLTDNAIFAIFGFKNDPLAEPVSKTVIYSLAPIQSIPSMNPIVYRVDFRSRQLVVSCKLV